MVLLQVIEIFNTRTDFDALRWFWGDLTEENFDEWRSKYPHGSEGEGYFDRVTGRFELAGVLISRGLLNEDLWFDRFGTGESEWEKSKPIIYGLRNEWKMPRFRENFELLVERGKKWSRNHPSKVRR